jgi:hypothetical protein
MNYAEFVNGATLSVHWQGQPPDTGTPKHPTRIVLENPLVYEYAYPIGGSYPPWTDPSYWYEGIRPHFNLKQQRSTIRDSLEKYYNVFSRMAALAAGFIMLLVWARDLRSFAQSILGRTFLWAPAILALGMYSLVLVERRYVSGFVIVLWLVLFSALRMPPTADGPAVLRSVTIAIVLVLGFPILGSVAQSSIQLRSRPFPDWKVAQELRRKGIGPGNRVAFIGAAAWDHYWAHLAEVSVVSEVADRDVATFWRASPEVKSRVVSLFEQAGSKAVIANGAPPGSLADGWEIVPKTDYYILPLGKWLEPRAE